MNTIFSPKILLFATLAALIAGLGFALQSTDKTDSGADSVAPSPMAAVAPTVAPPAPQKPALPPNILPSSPLAQVVKLAQAGLDESILMSYVTNCSGTFNLDSEQIIYATDAGVPGDIITAMMQ